MSWGKLEFVPRAGPLFRVAGVWREFCSLQSTALGGLSVKSPLQTF